MHPIRLLLVVLRRARMHGLGVLFSLFVAVVVSATLGFYQEARDTAAQAPVWSEALYYAIGLFAMAGNRFDFPRSTVLRVDYLLAPLIAASAVFGVFARILEERAPLFLRRFRNHTVIGGLGRLGMTIARHEHRRKNTFIALELNELAPQVGDAHELGSGHVLLGDMTSTALLQRARVHLARRVFLTANSDVANLDAAFHVRALGHAARVKNPPKVYVHVFDAGLSDSLEKHLRARHPAEADIIPFNSYRFAAKALVAMLLRDGIVPLLRVAPGLALVRTSWPRGGDALREDAVSREDALAEDKRRLFAAFRLGADESPANERLVLVGMGRFGHALARNLLDHGGPRAQGPSREGAHLPRFLVIDRSKERYDAQLDTFAPHERARFESYIGDPTEARCLDRIEAYNPSAALVCTDHDLGNLRIALDLHERKIRTVARMFDLETSSGFAAGLNERGIAMASLQRLFHAAIPILTHERRLLACVNLGAPHVEGGPALDPHAHDHLFYLARISERERRSLGDGAVGLDELPRDASCPAGPLPTDIALVWHRAVARLEAHASTMGTMGREV